MKINKFFKIQAICFISMFIIMIPNILQNHGLFLYAGDYAVQQIPFYYHVADYVKNCGIGWDWYTDLGSDLIVSYSFYLTGSLFFWAVSWLKGMAVVYAMPFMIAFKISVSSVGAYMYIQRYVENETAVFIGAYIYAFSGFNMVSLIYNHFSDITALFPFLLLSFDLLVTERKKVFFAIMVGLTALTNYFFFYGIFLFVIIYYVVKCICKDIKFKVRDFCCIAFESVIGIGIAAMLLVPTIFLLSSSDRVSSVLYGVNLLSYNDNTVVPKIIQSLFLIPDPVSGAMLFTSDENAHNWASISLYLPLFTVTGVVAYLKNYRNNWISSILKVSLLIAIIPGLNSAFSMFNSSYYARWYYMPVLIMSLATAIVIDNAIELKDGIRFSLIALIIMAVVFCLPNMVTKKTFNINQVIYNKSNTEKELKMFGMSEIPIVFWQCMAFAIVFLLVLFVYEYERRKKQDLLKKVSVIMIVMTVVTYSIYIKNTISQLEFDSNVCYNASIGFKPVIEDNGNYRITHATLQSKNNYSMIWGFMNAGCFHSVEANENDDFYYGVQGEKRMMMSAYEEEDYPVYGLLSIKYIFNLSTNDDLNIEYIPVKLKACSLYDKQGPYYIYKNDNFVPFGFCYDYCIDDDTLEKYLNENISTNKYQYKKLVMMRALVLDTDVIEKYSDYISPIPEKMLGDLNEETYCSDCNDRRAESCSSFEYDSKGYRAEITTEQKCLVYFSVPCSKGWSAKVNGKDVEIIKAHYGLTAIPVEAGDNNIECLYETPGLKEGRLITCISISILAVYFAFNMINEKKSNSLRRND